MALSASSQVEEETISETEYFSFDAYLSQCILNTPIHQLALIQRLPDFLDKAELFVSRSMLLYVLGHEDLVKKEYELKIDNDYIDYLKTVRDTDLGAPVPELVDCETRYGHLKSSVMGCEIKVSFPFRSPLVEVAETLLSVIEAFFSTNMVDRVVVIESRFEIEITADDDDEISISHELDDSGGTLKMEVLCSSFTPDMLSISGQGVIQKWLQDFVIETFAHLMRPKNVEETLESMLGEDRALERAVSFGSCFVGLHNIMGSNAVKEIKALLLDKELNTYKLLRSSPWDENFPKTQSAEKELSECKPGAGDVPEDLMCPESVSHREMKVQSLIKIRLWNRTVWRGAGFSIYPDGTPGLTLLYENEQAAEAIFSDLESELGRDDRANRLRVSIIRHIDKKSPAHYRICISENVSFSEARTVQLASRIQTMTPTSKDSIEGFLGVYKKMGRYVLSYATIENGKIIDSNSKRKKMVVKFDLNVIDAWEIGPNDIELSAVQETDDPIIPDGIVNPPIFEAIAKKFRS